MNSHHHSRRAGSRWVVALAGGVLGAVAALVWLRCIYLVLASRAVADPAFDPHGYGLIAGAVLSVPAALVTAVAVPFVFSARYRSRVARIIVPLLLVITAALWIAFATA